MPVFHPGDSVTSDTVPSGEPQVAIMQWGVLDVVSKSTAIVKFCYNNSGHLMGLYEAYVIGKPHIGPLVDGLQQLASELGISFFHAGPPVITLAAFDGHVSGIGGDTAVHWDELKTARGEKFLAAMKFILPLIWKYGPYILMIL